MGQKTTTATDTARAVATGGFTATGNGPWLALTWRDGGRYNVSVWGTFVGTVELDYSFDGGTTAVPVLNASGAAAALSAPGSMLGEQPEQDVLVRARCSARTSGTINWRISR